MRCACLPVAAALVATVAAQQPKCRLEGRVLDALLRPVVNARVVVHRPEDATALAVTRSDGSGCFVLGNVPAQELVVQAFADGPLRGVAWIDLLGLQRQFVTIETVPARAVHGTVRDGDGAPVGAAWVQAVPVFADPMAVAVSMVQADAQGRFALEHVPVGRHLLRVWSPGYECWEDAVDGDGNRAVDCELASPAGQERTVVLRGAAPQQATAARLVLATTNRGYPVPLPPPLLQLAPSDGAWRLRGWTLADELRVAVDGLAVEPLARVVPAERSAGDQVFTARADAPRLRGTLQGDGMRAGITITARPLLPTTVGRTVYGQTDAEGRFDLPACVPVGDGFVLRVLDAGVVTVRQGPVARRAWWEGCFDPDQACQIPVAAAEHVRLVAVDIDRTPAAGARVFVHKEAPQTPFGFATAPTIACGVTGLDGSLRVDGLDLRGDDTLTCHVESERGWVRHDFVPRAGTTDLGTLILEPAAELAITCLDRAGRPAVGLRVGILPHDGVERAMHVRYADRDGRLRYLGPPAQWVAVVPEHCPQQVVTMRAGQVTEVECVMQP